MKRSSHLAALVIVLSVLLSACSSVGFSVGQVAPATGSQSSAAAPLVRAPGISNSQAAVDAAGLQTAYEAVFQAVNPSVVTIEIGSRVGNSSGPGTSQRGQAGQGQIVPTAQGSGVIWDSAGHIVTNNHVVDGAARVTVTFSDGSSYDAKIVGTDPNTDLAVIQVAGAPASLIKPISVGDSTQVRVGELVVAIGNPYGLANTMTTGIVSAIGRSISSTTGNSQNGPSFSVPDVIQTDAAINPGNSGGALVDMNGAMIGMPSQIESQSGSNSGIGFAIPSAIVKQVAGQLISKGVASHSYLGISGVSVTADVITALNLKPGQTGVLVATVMAGGPASQAGVKPATVDANGVPTAAGDIITGIDGKATPTFEDLVSYLYSSTQPGQSVTLDVLRGGQPIQVQVTLGTQPTQ